MNNRAATANGVKASELQRMPDWWLSDEDLLEVDEYGATVARPFRTSDVGDLSRDLTGSGYQVSTVPLTLVPPPTEDGD